MATYGADTNVLAYWLMADLPEHPRVEAFLEREVYGGKGELAVCPLVLYELVHVVTDARRFELPLTMPAALSRAEQIWRAPETRQIHETEGVLPIAFDLMRAHGFGRKRILDTALAATLRANDIDRLITANDRDFAAFPFLQVINPLETKAGR